MSKQPHLFRFPHSKHGIHLVQQTKFIAHWVMHSDDHPIHILNLIPGIAHALVHQEGQVPYTASPSITNFLFVPIPAILFLPISFLLLSSTFIQPHNYPRASVLGYQASACCDPTQPYNNCINWDHITIKCVICMQYG